VKVTGLQGKLEVCNESERFVVKVRRLQ
jgi:hypothetical protein